MANQSIYAAFERFWQHVVARIENVADANHNHDDMYYTESEIDSKILELETKADATTKFNNAKTYIDEEIATLASNIAYIDENDNETVTLSVDLEVLSSLVGGDV